MSETKQLPTKPATDSKQLPEAPKDRLRAIMRQITPQIASLLPKHLTPEVMVGVVLTEGARNPDLRLCTAESLAASIILASQLGLKVSGPLGHFYLIPRFEKVNPRDKNSPKEWRCGYTIGYRGYAELARRADLRLNAGAVYRDEIARGLFAWTNDPPTLRHDGALGIDRADSNLVAAYCVAVDERRGRAGHRWQIVLDLAEIAKRRKMAQTQKVWDEHFAAMCRKTGIRALLSGGLVPLSAELQTALDAETTAERERADVIDADEIEEPAPKRDPLRAALGIPEKADGKTGSVDEVLDAAPVVDVVDRIVALEHEVGADGIAAAVKASGIAVTPETDLADLPADQVEAYRQALEAQRPKAAP
jgi:phage RecT family recombinase